MPEVIYCIDASSLICLHQDYPTDVFPGVWERFERLVQSGRLIAPVEVQKELQDDELVRWARASRHVFQNPTVELLTAVREILATFPSLIDPAKARPEADPFVIALAIGGKRTSSPLSVEHIVVTEEKKSRGKVKIPNVCEHYGIECIRLLDLFRRENWRF